MIAIFLFNSLTVTPQLLQNSRPETYVFWAEFNWIEVNYIE